MSKWEIGFVVLMMVLLIGIFVSNYYVFTSSERETNRFKDYNLLINPPFEMNSLFLGNQYTGIKDFNEFKTKLDKNFGEIIGVNIIMPDGRNISFPTSSFELEELCSRAEECWASVTTCKGGIEKVKQDQNTIKVKCK